MPDGAPMSIYDAAMLYKAENVPLVVWPAQNMAPAPAAIGPPKARLLLGVKAVLATSFERIHRSNLVGMGVLPLQFLAGQTWQSLGLTGEEAFEIPVDESLKARSKITVTATSPDGKSENIRNTGADRYTRLLPPRRHFANGAAEVSERINLKHCAARIATFSPGPLAGDQFTAFHLYFHMALQISNAVVAIRF